MTILVTGAAGFLGMHVALRRQYEIAHFDPANSATAHIFPVDHNENLFDPLPYGEEAAFA